MSFEDAQAHQPAGMAAAEAKLQARTPKISGRYTQSELTAWHDSMRTTRPPWKMDFDEPPKRSVGSDLARQAGSGLVEGIGMAVRGVGEWAADPFKSWEATPLGRIGRHFGIIPGRATDANPLEQPAAAVEGAGKGIAAGVSEQGQEAIQKSTPTGDITKPQTWSFGDDPTLEGYMLQGTRIMGQIAPQLVMAWLTRKSPAELQVGTQIPYGGAQAGGAAASEARETVEKMPATDLWVHSPRYRELMKETNDPQKARAELSREAERWAFEMTAPVGALGGAGTGLVLGKPGAALAARVPTRAGRGATLGAVAGTEESGQEIGEGIQTRRGIQRATGVPVDPTAGTFGEGVMGFMGGAPGGAVRGAATARARPGGAPDEAAPTPEPPVPAPTAGGPQQVQPQPTDVAQPAVQPPVEPPAQMPPAATEHRQMADELAAMEQAPGPTIPAQDAPPDARTQSDASGGDPIDLGPRIALPDDVLGSQGYPFLMRSAAQRAADRTGGVVVPLDEGGYVVRKQGGADVGADSDRRGSVASGDVAGDDAGPGRTDAAVPRQPADAVAAGSEAAAGRPVADARARGRGDSVARVEPFLGSAIGQPAAERAEPGIIEPSPAQVVESADGENSGSTADAAEKPPESTLQRIERKVRENTEGGRGAAQFSLAPPGDSRTAGTLEDLRRSLKDDGIENYISERDGKINVSQLVVPKDQRGRGKGSQAMQRLVDYADATKQRIVLSPSTDFGATSKARLTRFYKRFGFVENKGRDKDFTVSESMYRDPRGSVQFSRSDPRAAVRALRNLRPVDGSDQARQAAREFIGKPLTNSETGIVATVSASSIGKMMSRSTVESSASSRAHMRAVGNLDQLFPHALLRESRADREGNPDVAAWHHFEVPMPLDGQTLRVKILAKELTNKDQGTRLYVVQAVEIEEARVNRGESTTPDQQATPRSVPPAGFEGRFAELVRAVNSDVAPPSPGADGGVRSSLSGNETSGLPVPDVQEIVDRVRSTWNNAPPTEVIGSLSDAPPEVIGEWDRQKAADARGQVRGFWYRGKVYLVADALPTKEAVAKTLLHESLGHYGLQGVFGDSLQSVLKLIVVGRHPEVVAKAKQYGLNPKNPADLRIAAEEVLAELAESKPQLNLVQRALAAIRTWLRQNVPMLGSLPISDAEIARDFLEPARRYVEEGGARAESEDRPRFSLTEEQAEQRTLMEQWESPEPSKLDDFVHTLQDTHVDTKRVIETIRATGRKIADQWNPYLKEELFHGRSAKQTQDFLDTELRPLLQDMQQRGVSIADLERYLHARHAKERNAQIAKVNPDMVDGGSGLTNEEADAYLAALAPEKRSAYDALAKRVDRINDGTTQMLVDAGLEKPETIQAWKSAYRHYVPLHRADVESGGMGTGQGFSVRGPASKRAMGSKKEVVEILANIAMQRERAIVRAEKNRVSLAAYGLALQAPNKDFWLPVNPDAADKQKLARELVNLGLDAGDAANIAAEPKQRYVDPATGLVAERVNPLLRSRDNVLAARVNGEDRFVFFSESDPRAQRMVRSLKNLDADQLGRVLGTTAKVTRYFASMSTQYNPIFGVVNITRDVQGGLFNLSTTPIAGKQAAVMRHTLPALIGVYREARADRKGKDIDSKWSELWEEFQKNGGQTGYRDLFSNGKQRAEAIERELKRHSEGAVFRGGRAVLDWLSDYNLAMENSVRLAAYKVAKDQGISVDQAASIAKNLTVNFNRRGAVTRQTGALYAFFNASVQGTARILETLRGPAGKKIIAGGLAIGVLQPLMLALAGFEDDEIPDFVRERNLIIPIGGKRYVTIPMPLGFHIIPNLSRIPTEWAMSGFKDTSKHAISLLNVFADGLNPIGSAGLSMQTLAPTPVDPFAALAENRDWTGRPIARQDFSSTKPTPGYTRAKDTATEFSKALSYWLNIASGGTKYKPGVLSPTPDQIDYLIGQAFGGLGREVSKLEQSVRSTWNKEELPTHKIPLVGRFYGSADDRATTTTRYYNNLRELGAHDRELDGRKRNKEPVADYLQKYPEAKLADQADRVQREVAKLQREKRALSENDAPKEQIRKIEDQIQTRMRRFNEQLSQVRNKRVPDTQNGRQ